MPRRVLVLLPISLALLCLVAALSWPRVASPVEAQGSDDVTLLALDNNYGILYEIDPQTGAIGPVVQSLPGQAGGLSPDSISRIPGTREVLISVNPSGLYDPSSVMRVDLDRVKYGSLHYQTVAANLAGAARAVARPDGSALLVPQFRWALSYAGDPPITEVNLQTGATRTFATVPRAYQPWALLFTPSGRLFLGAGNGDNCSLFEMDPVSGTRLHRWPITCDAGGTAAGLAYDPTTGDLIIADGSLYISRFNPDHDSQPSVWTTWPRAFWFLSIDPQGNLYGPAMGNLGQAFGVLKMAPDKTARWLLPPGSSRTGTHDMSWIQPVEVFVGPRPQPLHPLATVTPTSAPDTPTPTVFVTPTPTPTRQPNQVDLVITPSPQQVGYFSSLQGAHVGADTLFAGVLGGDIYHGVVQFDLPDLPTGARVIGASIRLVGKTDAFLTSDSSAHWELTALAPEHDTLLSTMVYTDVHSAGLMATFSPTMYPAQLSVEGVNTFPISGLSLDVLSRQQHPAGKLTLRLDGPQGGFIQNDLFGWYSGTGSGDAAKAPQLRISYVAPVTMTATPTATETASLTPSPSPTEGEGSQTPTPTTTMTPTFAATSTPTATLSLTPSPSATPREGSQTPTLTATATATPSPSATREPTATPTPTIPTTSVRFDKLFYVGTSDVARVRVFDPMVSQGPVYARASSSGSPGTVVLTLWPNPTTPGLFVSDEGLAFCLPDACSSSGTNPTLHLRVLPPSTDLTVEYPATNPKATGMAQWFETTPSTATPTLTPSPSPMLEPSQTPTPSATVTPTSTSTSTQTTTATMTATSTLTPTPTPSVTITPSASPTATLTPSPTQGEGSTTATPTVTPTRPTGQHRLYLPLLSR